MVRLNRWQARAVSDFATEHGPVELDEIRFGPARLVYLKEKDGKTVYNVGTRGRINRVTAVRTLDPVTGGPRCTCS